MASATKMTTKFVLSDPPVPISCHAWNKDRTLLAMSPNNNDVQIHKFNGTGFELVAELKEHGSRVTGIDWAPESNRIATCGEDRNAYVFDLKGGVWKPTLVILRINRAATCVKWSPKEDKFAVGSGSRVISVCYFEEENDWWVSKHIKKPIRSSIISIDWHPNNVLIAAGGTDFMARVFSGYIKGLDPKPDATAWGKKMKFGECMAEYGTGAGGGGWIHGVSFDTTGNKMAYVGHDSSITVVDKESGNPPVRLETKDLPYRCISWITPASFVVAGHDCTPVVYEFDGASLTKKGALDVPAKKDVNKRVSAMDRFKQLDSKGTADASLMETTLKTTHQNSINELRVFSGDKSKAAALCTAGIDGKLVIWDLAKLAASIKMEIK